MSYGTDSGVHLTHLICEIVKTTTKVNLHLLRLRHDGLEGHTTNCGIEGAKEEGTVEVAGSVISSCGHFNRSLALLHRIEPALMAPMAVKKGEEGMGM